MRLTVYGSTLLLVFMKIDGVTRNCQLFNDFLGIGLPSETWRKVLDVATPAGHHIGGVHYLADGAGNGIGLGIIDAESHGERVAVVVLLVLDDSGNLRETAAEDWKTRLDEVEDTVGEGVIIVEAEILHKDDADIGLGHIGRQITERHTTYKLHTVRHANLGRKSLEEVMAKLDSLGFKLNTDDE